MKVLNEYIYLKYNKIFILGYTLCSIKLSCTFEVLNLKVAGPKKFFPTPTDMIDQKNQLKATQSKNRSKTAAKVEKKVENVCPGQCQPNEDFRTCIPELFVKFWNLVEIQKFGSNSENWLKCRNLVEILKCGRHFKIW